jgi:hypothetical protein
MDTDVPRAIPREQGHSIANLRFALGARTILQDRRRAAEEFFGLGAGI